MICLEPALWSGWRPHYDLPRDPTMICPETPLWPAWRPHDLPRDPTTICPETPPRSAWRPHDLPRDPTTICPETPLRSAQRPHYDLPRDPTMTCLETPWSAQRPHYDLPRDPTRICLMTHSLAHLSVALSSSWVGSASRLGWPLVAAGAPGGRSGSAWCTQGGGRCGTVHSVAAARWRRPGTTNQTHNISLLPPIKHTSLNINSSHTFCHASLTPAWHHEIKHTRMDRNGSYAFRQASSHQHQSPLWIRTGAGRWTRQTATEQGRDSIHE